MAPTLVPDTWPVALGGCPDLRDLGGYPAGGAWHTRHRRLYRCGAPHRLARPDRAAVARLGLATVLDLRTPAEVARDGGALLETAHHAVPVHDGAPGVPVPTEPAALAARWLATLDGNVDAVREVLAILTDPSAYPAVICCSSGTGRTAVMTAVVLGLLGVPDQAIVRDYAASRQAVVRRVGCRYFEQAGDLARLGSPIGTHDPTAMAEFLQCLRALHGSFAGYAEAIDMAGAVRYLRVALLEPTLT